MTATAHPVAGTGPTAHFFAALADGRLAIQRCTACNAAIHRPRLVCRSCGATDLAWEEASGRGTVYAVTDVARPPRAFRDDGPFQIAMIDLVEGARVMARIVGAPVRIGTDVELVGDRGPDGPRLAFTEVAS